MAADSEKKKAWDRENMVMISFKVFRSTDKDIIEFLSTGNRSGKIKAALREYMERHKES